MADEMTVSTDDGGERRGQWQSRWKDTPEGRARMADREAKRLASRAKNRRAKLRAAKLAEHGAPTRVTAVEEIRRRLKKTETPKKKRSLAFYRRIQKLATESRKR